MEEQIPAVPAFETPQVDTYPAQPERDRHEHPTHEPVRSPSDQKLHRSQRGDRQETACPGKDCDQADVIPERDGRTLLQMVKIGHDVRSVREEDEPQRAGQQQDPPPAREQTVPRGGPHAADVRHPGQEEIPRQIVVVPPSTVDHAKDEEPAGKKNEIYSLGDYIGGYIISAIEEKKVVLDYYGEKVTLNLHEGKEGAKGDFTPIEAAPPPPQPAASQPAKPLKQRVQEQQDQKKVKEEMENQLAAGQIPEALANSPFMSQDNMKKLLDFNKEIMDELKDSGGNMDQYAIKDRVEKFRDRFMEEMGGAQPPGAPE